MPAALAVSLLGLGVVVLMTTPTRAYSQDRALTRSAVVRVSVVGADGARLGGVNLAISRKDVGAILSGRTNDSGIHVFRVPIEPVEYAVSARRPGFAPAESALALGRSDSVFVTLRLHQAPTTQLAPITVEASRSNYVLDASQIAASGRLIRDAFEALKKLRPSMLYDKDRCKAEVVDNVWINCRRVLFMAKQVPAFGARSSRLVAGMRITTVGGGHSSEPPAVDSVLASIRSEHLAEIRLVNCWDTSMPGVGGKNALYVSLKPGVDWDWKRGSFVVDSLERRQ